MFVRSGTTDATTKLVANDGAAHDWFAIPRLDGDTVVGAVQGSDSGSVYVFVVRTRRGRNNKNSSRTTGRRMTISAFPSHSMAIRSSFVLLVTTIKALIVEAFTCSFVRGRRGRNNKNSSRTTGRRVTVSALPFDSMAITPWLVLIWATIVEALTCSLVRGRRGRNNKNSSRTTGGE